MTQVRLGYTVGEDQDKIKSSVKLFNLKRSLTKNVNTNTCCFYCFHVKFCTDTYNKMKILYDYKGDEEDNGSIHVFAFFNEHIYIKPQSQSRNIIILLNTQIFMSDLHLIISQFCHLPRQLFETE